MDDPKWKRQSRIKWKNLVYLPKIVDAANNVIQTAFNKRTYMRKENGMLVRVIKKVIPKKREVVNEDGTIVLDEHVS